MDLDWQPCLSDFECAVAELPRDHDEPDGETVGVALLKMAAADPDERIGTVFVNAGVQAGGGTALLASQAPAFAPLTSRFDVIGFDARGTGEGMPAVRCGTFEDEREIEDPVHAFPTVAELPRLWREARDYVQLCADRSGPLLPHVDTANVARDLDVLRAAVGDQALTFFGGSYGSVIAQYYTSMFPDRVRAMVLDSAIDARGYANRPLRFDVEQLAGTERALEGFFDWCTASPELCSFGDGAPREAYDDLVDRLEDNRRDHPGRHDVLTGGALLTMTVGALTDASQWPQFADQLATFAAAELPIQPLPSGDNPVLAQFLAHSCLDRAVPSNPVLHGLHQLRAAKASPHFGALFGFGALKCAQWPVASSDRLAGPWHHQSDSPALVINNTADPFSPAEWGPRVTQRLGNAQLLEVEGPGHTAFGRGIDCVDQAVVAYLNSLELPEPGTTCQIPLPGSEDG